MHPLQNKDKLFIFFSYLLLTLLIAPHIFGITSLKDTENFFYGYEGDSDLAISRYFVAWSAHSLLTDPLNIFHTNLYYPHHYTLLLGDSYLTIALLTIPFHFIIDNAIFGYNLTILFLILLSAYATFLLAQYYTRNKYASYVAGIIFGFYSFKILISYLSFMLAVAFIPLILLYIHKLIDNPNSKNMLLLFLLLLATIFSGWYIAALLALTLLVLLPCILYYEHKRITKRFIAKISICFSVLLLLMIPFIYSYHSVYTSLSNKPRFDDLIGTSVPIVDYTRPIAGVTFYHHLIPALETEGTVPVFLGYIPILLILLGVPYLLIRKEKTPYLIPYLLLALLAFLLSLGPFIQTSTNQQYLNKQPIFYYLPFMYGILEPIRSLSRYAFIVMFGVSMSVAFILSKLSFKNKRTYLFVTILLSILIFAEHYPIEKNLFLISTTEIPPYIQWLKEQPGDFAILELPDAAELYAFYSTYHWKKIVNGESSAIPNDYYPLMRILSTFPSEESIYHLQRLNITYIILHHDLYTPDYNLNATILAQTLKKIENEPRVHLIKKYPDMTIYTLNQEARIQPSIFIYHNTNWRSSVPTRMNNQLRISGMMQENGTITIISPSQQNVNLTLQINSPYKNRTLTIFNNQKKHLTAFIPQQQLVHITLTDLPLLQGENTLRFTTPEPCTIPFFETKAYNFACETLEISFAPTYKETYAPY